MTTSTGRWHVWTGGETGSWMTGTAVPATSVYRLADGTYVTVGPDGTFGTREVRSAERPSAPDGSPIPLQWKRLVLRLPRGPATDALVTDLERAGGRPDRELLSRLVAAGGANPDAPALLLAEGVRVDCRRDGRVGRLVKPRRMDVVVTYYL